MNETVSLAYSTCPNDTYIFHGMTHQLSDTLGLTFAPYLDDVESLNTKAQTATFDVTKLSYAAFGHVRDTYALLKSGSALGRGCGPLLVAKPGMRLSQLDTARIAVPGHMTTANLLLSLYTGKKLDTIPMTFDKIMPSLSENKVDCGVIIHEGRFTYTNFGLTQLVDLGAWWEESTGLPIPLGGIAVKRALGKEISETNISATIDTAIVNSIQYARNNPDAAKKYIKQHAMELDDDVISQHIKLYVNEFSLQLGDAGEAAIVCLFEKAEAAGFFPSSEKSLFY